MEMDIKQIEVLMARSKSKEDLMRVAPLIKQLPDGSMKQAMGDAFAQLWMLFQQAPKV